MATISQQSISNLNYSTERTQKVGFVLHWIAGERSAADATFKDPKRQASAHFGIGSDGKVNQYVDTSFVAWHAGSLAANRKYIGIEHAGGQLVNGTRKKPTDQCHRASVDLITKLCRDMGIKKLERKVNIFKHNEVSPRYTECCGTLDIDWITTEVNKNLNPMPQDTRDALTKFYDGVKANNNWDLALQSIVDRDLEIFQKMWAKGGDPVVMARASTLMKNMEFYCSLKATNDWGRMIGSLKDRDAEITNLKK